MLLATQVLNAQWMEISPDTTFRHNRIYFNSATKGIVGGYWGVYQQTYDGGTTWDTSEVEFDANWSTCNLSPYAYHLTSIHFPSDTIGYIGGEDGILFKTFDSGISWRCMGCTNCWDDLKDVYFFNNDTGVAASVYFIQRTTDGGVTWSNISLYFDVERFASVDDSTLIVVGQRIRRSTDHGLTWLPTVSDTTTAFHDVSMGSNLNGIAVSWSGRVTRTTDGGVNWSTPVQIATTRISNVEMRNDTFGFITLGDNWQANPNSQEVGYVMHTTDGGITWIQLDTIGTKTMTDLSFPHDSVLYSCGWLGNIMKTEHPVRPNSGVGTEEPDFYTNFILFPNPAQDFLHVFIPGQVSTTAANFLINDVSGRVLVPQHQLTLAPYQIDISNLPSGVYFLHCTVNGIESVSKFIVQ